MRIAITVHQQFSFFSAGSPQTALSLGETLRLKSHEVFFINTAESKANWWEDVKGISGDWTVVHKDDLSQGADLLIEVGTSFLTKEQRALFGRAVWLCRKPLLFGHLPKLNGGDAIFFVRK